MKTLTPRITKAIDVFLDAINKGTLAKGTCAMCACGNLAADAHNIKLSKNLMDIGNRKKHSIVADKIYTIWGPQNNKNVNKFTPYELLQIETAFESNTKIHWNDYVDHTKKEIRADQIKGLEAVVKVMMTFDEVEEDVKEVFTAKAELIEL